MDSVLGGLIPLIFGLAMAGYFYWECVSPRTKSPENDRRQIFYNRLWYWVIKPETRSARRKWNGIVLVTAGCAFAATGVLLLSL
jgi:hypothetical protein